MDFLTPQVFDVLIIANIAVGLTLAARKFYRNVTGPLPEEAPEWAHEKYKSDSSPHTTTDSDNHAPS